MNNDAMNIVLQYIENNYPILGFYDNLNLDSLDNDKNKGFAIATLEEKIFKFAGYGNVVWRLEIYQNWRLDEDNYIMNTILDIVKFIYNRFEIICDYEEIKDPQNIANNDYLGVSLKIAAPIYEDDLIK